MYATIIIGDEIKVMPPVQYDSAIGIIKNALLNKDSTFLVFRGAPDNILTFSQEVSELSFHPDTANLTISKIRSLSDTMDLKYIQEFSEEKGKDNEYRRHVTMDQLVGELSKSGVDQAISVAKLVSHVKSNKSTLTIKNYCFGSDGENLFDNVIDKDLVLDEEEDTEEAKVNKGLEIHGDGITAAYNLKKMPTVLNMPPHIADNEVAHKIWQMVNKRFNKLIKAESDLKRRWAIAVIKYRQACIKKGVVPFKKQSISNESVRKKMVDDDNMIDEYIGMMIEEGRKEALLNSVSMERYLNTEYKGSKYILTTIRTIGMKKDINVDDIQNFFRDAFGFKRKGREMVKDFSTRADIILTEVNDKAMLYVKYKINKANVLPLVYPLEPLNKEQSIKAIHKLARVWFQTGHLRFRKKDL